MIGSLSMEDLGRLRRMSPTDAEAWLKSFTLTEDELATAMRLAGKDLPSTPPPDKREQSVPRGQIFDASRPLWFVSAWLMGASWRQLAYMHKISPQTVTASADRLMPSVQRQAARLNPTMSYEALSEYRATFLKGDWKGKSPLEVANTLLSTTELDK